MRRAARSLLVLLVFASGLSIAHGLSAHDLWIEPSNFRPAEAQLFAVRLRVGEAFKGDPVPRMEKRIERFAAIGPGGEVPLKGTEGADPAGLAVLPASGSWLLVYDSNHARVELEGPKFESYLLEEGLEKISRLRAERGQTAAPSREIYSRCAKSLVLVGKGPVEGYDRVLGLPLELVPQASPAGLAEGAELPVLLLFQGKPLPGALVMAIPGVRPLPRVSARTDAEGRVRLRLDGKGDWLIKAVHMEPAAADREADWESFWASLTFQR